MHFLLRVNLSLLGLVLGTGASSQLTAQSSAWADLQVPQGVVSTSVRGQGKLASYQEANTVHLFSSITRRWHTTNTATGASLRLFNDCAVIEEPNLCRAFSAHTGQFEDLVTTGGFMVRNATGNKNDSIVLVSSGNQLHAFSAFTGQWSSRTITTSLATDVQRHVAVIHDGNTLSGYSAFDGLWYEQACPLPPTSMHADGTAAFASTALHNYAFSAHTKQWQLAPDLSNATFVRGDDWGLWYANGALEAYSSLRGEFIRASPGVTGVAGSTDLYALLSTATGLCAFSAVTGDLLTIAQLPNSITLGNATALLHCDKSVRGYSALRQQTATLLTTTQVSDAANLVAFVTSPLGQSFVWSSYTASWHTAPASTNGSSATLTETTVALESATDCFAFAARTGQFVPLGGPVLGLVSNPTSAPLLGYDALNLHAFDTDGERWLSTPRTSSIAPIFAIWRTSALALDGANAHGFGAQAAAWQEHGLATGNAAANANSEVVYVVQSNQIAACSMLSEIISYQQFPHFRRIQPRGSAISWAAAPPATAFAIAAFAPPLMPVSLPGLGTLLLDANIAMLAPLVPTPSKPVCTVTLQLPGNAILSGTTLASQLLVLPSNAPAYISERATVQLW